jgi:hypothetical protein
MSDTVAAIEAASAANDSEEKREPVSDVDIAAADSLKALDPNRPIREADINAARTNVWLRGKADIAECPLLTQSEPASSD